MHARGDGCATRFAFYYGYPPLKSAHCATLHLHRRLSLLSADEIAPFHARDFMGTPSPVLVRRTVFTRRHTGGFSHELRAALQASSLKIYASMGTC